MRFYSVETFRKSLGEILDRVRFSGESATIKKRGKPIVVITPIAETVISEPTIGTPAPSLPTAALTKKVKP